MTIQNLHNIEIDKLLDSFFLAFEDYFVKMPTDRNYYKERWRAAKVDFNYSYGMFDKDKLVGFIIHAIDHRGGKLTAFNTGTGVIPDYRGQKIIKAIYEYALDDLGRNGVVDCSLEVITKNTIAIRSYKSIGFDISRRYKCFNGTINCENSETFDLKEIGFNNVDWESLPNQRFYSWDNQKESIQNKNYKFFQVLKDKSPESFFVINPSSGFLAQFDLLTERKNSWNRLFSAVKRISDKVKIVNVDERLTTKLENIEKLGLVNSVDQYEMRLIIKGDSNPN